MIHRTAIIDPRAEIDSECDIGPYVVVDGAVKIGRATRVMAHATIMGWTEIGAENEIHPGAVLGGTPQDKAYRGAESYLKIAERNVFREHVTVHRGAYLRCQRFVHDTVFLVSARGVAFRIRSHGSCPDSLENPRVRGSGRATLWADTVPHVLRIRGPEPPDIRLSASAHPSLV